MAVNPSTRSTSNKASSNAHIFLYVPNLIGYLRIILALVSFYYMPFDLGKAVFTYLVSQLLDAFDGYAARTLNQSTSFGAVLDMVTDRCSTLCLLMVLGLFYPNYLLVFQMIAGLDIFSHWMQMYSSLMQGDSHKNVTNPILKIYYSRVALFTFCAGNELFFISLYMMYFSVGPIITIFGYEKGWFEILAVLTFPISLGKNFISVVQMIYAAKNIAANDAAQKVKRDH